MITVAGCSFQKLGIYETEMEQKLRRPRMKGMQMFQFLGGPREKYLKECQKKRIKSVKNHIYKGFKKLTKHIMN